MSPSLVKTTIFEFGSELARDGRFHRLAADGLGQSVVGETGAAASLDATGHAVENLNALDRVLAHGGFTAQHDAVGLFEDGIGDVGDFRAGRHGILDHRLQHVRGHDDGAADL